MGRARLVLLLVMISLLAATSLMAAGLSTGDWPKSRRDAANSGCSPTTAIAQPSFEWVQDTAANGAGVAISYGTLLGPVLDANNLYTNDCGNGPNGYTFGYRRDGTYLWTAKTTPGSPSSSAGGYLELAQDFINYGGITLWNDGNSDFLLAGPGGSDPNNAMWWFDITTGQQSGAFIDVNPANTRLVSYDSSTVGPDGTIYTFIGDSVNYFYGGTIYAIDGATHTVKWSWGANGTVPGGKSLGFHTGPMALTTVNGKQVLIVGMAQNKTSDIPGAPAPYSPYGGSSLFAIQDDGTTCSVLWSKQPAYNRWNPVISNDGQTVYIACEEAWQGDANYKNTLYAYNVVTGTQKWAINTRAEHNSTPAIGKDGTIYLTSTCRQGSGNRYDPSGKLIAVQDNGGSATIKWSIYWDYESDSYFSSPVVTSTTPTVVYFGSTSGRVYAVQDLGSTYKILWTYARTGAGTGNWPVPVIGNDGKLYAHWGKYLVAFKTGFDPNQPCGISGYVKGTGGNPVSGAYVVASTSNNPLFGISGKYFVKTDANGYYNITVPAGTWYVSAWARSRLTTDVQSVVIPTDTSAATMQDFVLTLAGPNLALNKPGYTNKPDTATALQGPEKAFDGGDGANSRFTCDENQVNPISPTNPSWLMVDLGSNTTIGEATMRWEGAYAKTYSIQYLVDDGTGMDPTVEANWTAKGVTIASTTNGNWGLPIRWYGVGNGSIDERVEIARFTPTPARWWRLIATATNYAKFFSIWEWELRDGRPAGPASGACGDVRNVADGGNIILENKIVTALPGAGVPDDTVYVEDTNRAGAIRVHATNLAALNLGIGDVVVAGGIAATATPSGEKFIDSGNISKTTPGMPINAVVMNSRSAAQSTSQGLFVKLTGKVSAVGADNFTINDGGVPVNVKCGSLDKPSVDDVVIVRGVISTDGTNPVLLMRNERVDWTYGNAGFQPLPLPGRYKYSREFLICGPFADANSVYPEGATDDQKVEIQGYRLNHDFIADATGGDHTEDGEKAIHPSEGEACGSNVWTRYVAGGSDNVNFTAAYPTNNTYCAFYAHTYIWSPIDQSIAMRVGSDDSVKVFINGLEIWRNQVYNTGTTPYGFGRGETIGADYIAYAPLSAGLNSVLLKVEQGVGGSGVDCQFLDPDPTKMGAAGYGGAEPFPGLGYVVDKVPGLFP